MRSTILIIIIYFSCVTCVRAQTYSYVAFPDSNAHWYYYGIIHPMGGDVSLDWRYFYDGDTIINNVAYHNITGSDYGLIRTDSEKRTYFHYSYLSAYDEAYYDTIDHPIYDFSLGVKDTMIDSTFWLGSYSPLIIVIDSIDTVLIDNSYRREFFVSSSGYGKDIWIEGIGSLNNSAISYFGNGPGFAMNLCKFIQNDSVVYHVCNSDGINPIQELTFNIYPDPFEDYVLIECQNYTGLLSATFFNAIGQRLSSKTFTYQLQLDLADYPAGMYLLQITNEDGQRVVKKVVKQ